MSDTRTCWCCGRGAEARRSAWTCPRCEAKGATKTIDPAFNARFDAAIREWAMKGDA